MLIGCRGLRSDVGQHWLNRECNGYQVKLAPDSPVSYSRIWGWRIWCQLPLVQYHSLWSPSIVTWWSLCERRYAIIEISGSQKYILPISPKSFCNYEHSRNQPFSIKRRQNMYICVRISIYVYAHVCICMRMYVCINVSISLEFRFLTQFQWREAYVLDNWQLAKLPQSGGREFDPRRVHDNLSVPLWVYMRFPVPEHQN